MLCFSCLERTLTLSITETLKIILYLIQLTQIFILNIFKILKCLDKTNRENCIFTISLELLVNFFKSHFHDTKWINHIWQLFSVILNTISICNHRQSFHQNVIFSKKKNYMFSKKGKLTNGSQGMQKCQFTQVQLAGKCNQEILLVFALK